MSDKKQSGSKEPRKLKIYPKHFTRVYKSVVLPEIRLSGKWLQQCGFDSGKTIQVHCEENKITITIYPEREGGKK